MTKQFVPQLAVVASLVVSMASTLTFAQAIPHSDLPQTQPSEQPRRNTGGVGIGLSFKFRSKQPAVTSMVEPTLEMRDAVIEEFIPDQVIFVVRGRDQDLAAIAAAANVTIIDTSWLDEAGITMVVASLRAGDTPQTSAQRLGRLPSVVWAQPNYQFQLLGGALPRRFALHKIPERQPRVSGKIVMIDAVVDTGHPNLAGAGVEQRIFGVTQTSAVHGTAVAALLVGTGNYPGTAMGAHLTSLAAFGAPQAGVSLSRTAYLARAMNEASRLRPDVLNLSFGGPQDRLLGVMLDTIHTNGVCVSAAAGNGGAQGRVLFPASHPDSLAVTAIDEDLTAYTYASTGERVDIAGVGVGLSAAVPGGRRTVSGTSFSTAVISGALLRMPACNGGRNPSLMKQNVSAYAQDLGPPGKDNVFGAGLFRLTPARKRN